MTPEEFFKETDHEEGSVEAKENADDLSNHIGLIYEKSQVLRIEEKVARSWSGVKSCGDADRVQSELNTAVQGWLKEKIFQHRHLRYLNYGYHDVKWRASRTGGGLGGARSCRGSLAMTCYVEFAEYKI